MDKIDLFATEGKLDKDWNQENDKKKGFPFRLDLLCEFFLRARPL